MMMNEVQQFENLNEKLKGKKILFIATKNYDYIRIAQEMDMLRSISADIKFIVSKQKKYFLRLFEILIRVMFCKTKGYDIVFIGFQAQFILPFYKWKFKSSEVWTDFFISLYDTLVFDRKSIREKSFLARCVKMLDSYTLSKSDFIVCDTKAHGRYFADEFGINIKKIYVLYLKADNTIYFSRHINKPTKWRHKFIVFYFGSILPLQGVDIVLKTVELMKDYNNIHFIVVGPIHKKLKKVEESNVTYIDWLTQDKLAQYIAFSDLCLAGHFSLEIEKANRTIPGKAYIYENMGKKMILGDGDANRERYIGNENAIFVPRGDAEALVNVILEMVYQAEN